MTEEKRGPGRPASADGAKPLLNVRVPLDVQTAARERAERDGSPFATVVEYLLAAYAADTEDTMNQFERVRLVATVIAAAREDFSQGAKGRTDAGFDYGLAADLDASKMSLDAALYRIANRGRHDDPAEECTQRWLELKTDLAPELDAFRAKCKARKYTGWSLHSTGPIRYAKAVG